MTETQQNKPAAIVAHILSDVASPLLMPTYGMIAAMTLTHLRYLPVSARVWATLGVSAITSLLPLIIIMILIKRGKVSDMSISNPRERVLPYTLNITCMIGAVFFLAGMNAPLWLSVFVAGAAVVSLVFMFITFKWKISAHTGGIAGLSAFVFWLGHNSLIDGNPLLWVSIAFFLTGALAWARLYLRHHTVMQVFAGAMVAFGIEYAMLCLFCNA